MVSNFQYSSTHWTFGGNLSGLPGQPVVVGIIYKPNALLAAKPVVLMYWRQIVFYL